MNTQPPMKRRRLRQSNQSPSVILPDDLMVEIFSWLTVKLLMKMKCVSKSLKTLISDPIFVKTHLNRSARNSHSYLVSHKNSIQEGDCRFVPFSVRGLLENLSVNIPKDPYYQLIDKECRQVVGSCNGLVCLLGYDEDQGEEMWLRLWNPATRTISDKLGYLHDDEKYRLKYWHFEFGYNNSTNTYKVVALRCSNMTTDVQVLSFGNNIWRNIQSYPARFLLFYSYSTREYGGVTGLQLNCTINWLANVKNQNLGFQFAIISLDLDTEILTQFLSPLDLRVQDYLRLSSVLPGICALMGSLCFYHEFEGTNFVIWKMTEFGEEKSWTQFLKFSYDNLQMNFKPGLWCLSYFNIYQNGDTMVFAHNRQEQAILYNWRDNRVVKTRVDKKICWFSISNYVESLVSTC